MKRALLTTMVLGGALCLTSTGFAQGGDEAICDPTFPDCGGAPPQQICYADSDCGTGSYCEYYTGCDAEPCAPGETCDPVPCEAEGYCVYDGRCYSDADCGSGQACIFSSAGDRAAPAPCICADDDPDCTTCGGGGLIDPGPGYGYCESTGPIYCGSDIDCPAGTRCGASSGGAADPAPCAPGTNCTDREAFVANTCEPSVVPCFSDADCSDDWTCETPQQSSGGRSASSNSSSGIQAPDEDIAVAQQYCTPPGEEVKCSGSICEIIGGGGDDDEDRRGNDDCTTAPGTASTSSILLAVFALGLFLLRRR